MSWNGLSQYAVFLVIVTSLVKPVGSYMAKVFTGRPNFLDPILRPVEKILYWIARVNPEREMNWKEYASCFVIFGGVGTLLLYALLRAQHMLPWFYPKAMTTPMTPDLAMNIAISFATTTTWQAYGGEATMSYASQMAVL